MKVASLQRLTLTALFAAVITLTTAYLFHIPLATGGYIHLGDAFIYFAACFLPMPYAATAAGVGSGLADLLSGAPQWVPFTVVIKALMAMVFTSKTDRVIGVRNVIGSFAAGVICTAGYYFAEVILYGNWITPFFTMWGALVQSGSAVVLFVVGGLLLDKARIKNRLRNLNQP